MKTFFIAILLIAMFLLGILAGCIKNPKPPTLEQHVYDVYYVNTVTVIRAAAECGVDADFVLRTLDDAYGNQAKLWDWQNRIYEACRSKIPGYVDTRGIRDRLILLEAWAPDYQAELDKLELNHADLNEWNQRMQKATNDAATKMRAKYASKGLN